MIRQFRNNKIIKYIGSGSCGKIYIIKNEDDETAAIKKMSKHETSHIDFVGVFSILEKLVHPNIINFYDYYEDSSYIYQVMEYIKGQDLFELLGDKPFEEDMALKYLIEIKNGVDYIHSHNIIHRDIKLENIMVRRSNRSDVNIVIIDFGYAIEIHEDMEYTLCGTVDYMAPEMILELPYDCTLDLWSLGIIGYELIELLPPFYSSSPANTKIKIVGKNFNFPHDFPYEYGKIINKLLSLKPHNRIFEI